MRLTPLIGMVDRFRRWIGGSVQRRLLVWSTAFWIISISILSLSLILMGQSIMVREASQRNTQLASIISRDVNAQISTVTSEARTFVRHLENIDPGLISQAEAILALRLASPHRYSAAHYFNDEGSLLFSLADPPESLNLIQSAAAIVARPPGPVPALVTETRIAAAGESSISRVHFAGIARSPVMYLAAPISTVESDGRKVVLEIDLRDIWRRIDLTTVGQTGFAYMVSSDGRVIAHPDPAKIQERIPAEIEPVLDGVEDFVEYFDPSLGRTVLAAFSPVGGQTRWGVIVQQDRSEIRAAIGGAALLSIGISLVLAIVGTASISVLIRSFARPIINLTRTTQEIARTRQLTRTPALQRYDEVGRLSEAFDQMIDHLQSADREIRTAQDELENRVVERTAELTDANARLEREIAQREEAEEALRQSEVKYRHLVESASTIILEMDTAGRVTYFNKFAEGFFGFTQAEIIGKSVVGTIVPETDSSGDDLKEMIDDIVRDPESYRHNENENMRRNGDRVRIMWTNQALYNDDGSLREILCVGIDVTEQRRNDELQARQLREQAAATERTRLARDLHDAVSQTLFSASLVAEVVPRLWEKDPDEARRRLQEIRQLTRGALAEMRTLLFELRPAALADAELADLLRQLGESVTGRVRVPVTVEIEGQCSFPPDTKIALYRIAQEALNNVAKHSGADRAHVSLLCHPDRVEMHIIDNGKGFEPSLARGKSLGLGIMSERAAAIGATIDIRSGKEQGTEVTVVCLQKEE